MPPRGAPVARVRRQIGVELGAGEIADLIGPIGFSVLDGGRGDVRRGDEQITVTVPTNRPDVRPEPHGVDDVIEEVARRSATRTSRATCRPGPSRAL